MPRPVQHRDDLRTRLGEIAGWQTAQRDDAKVVREAHHTRELDSIGSLNESACFDELFHRIREIGAWPLLEQLDPSDRTGALYPFLQFVLFTIMRVVGSEVVPIAISTGYSLRRRDELSRPAIDQLGRVVADLLESLRSVGAKLAGNWPQSKIAELQSAAWQPKYRPASTAG